jgi:uncharacterized repeat protein (TIGR03803 family)
MKLIVPVVLMLLAALAGPARATEPQILYSFQGALGALGATLSQGPDGNFYGTTTTGGPLAEGAFIRVTPDGTLTTLASFPTAPASGLALGPDGAFYGLTGSDGPFGWGTVFRVTTNGVLTVIADFNGLNGGNPQAGLTLASNGVFYGATQEGGELGEGNVFSVTTNGVLTSLAEFNVSNGGFPQAALSVGPDGNLYGTTPQGGPGGGGTIFRLVLQPLFTGITPTSSGNIVLTGTGLPQTPYRLWAASDLSLPFVSWTLLTNGQSATDGSFTFTDNTPAPTARYYRTTTP